MKTPWRGRGAELVPGVFLLAALLALALFSLGCGEDAEAPSSTTEQAETAPAVPVRSEQCLSCHTDFAERISNENQRVFSHELHLEQEIDCSACHSDVGHDGAPIHHPSSCQDCHGITMPHPGGYINEHGEQVLDEGTDVCTRCHHIHLHCQACHGIEMPHPAEWEQKHGELAVPELESCRQCHQSDYCLQCHPVEMPHPGDWIKTHGLPVVDQGSAACTRCHEPDLCVSCHGMPMPHPEDWGTGHPAVAAEKRAECLLCHTEQDCADCHEIHQTHGKDGV